MEKLRERADGASSGTSGARRHAGESLTRRAFVGGAAVTALGLALAGCSGDSETDEGNYENVDYGENEGYATDCERASEAVTVKLYVDSCIQNHLQSEEYENAMEKLTAAYREKVTDLVTFEWEFVEPFELLDMCENGLPDDGDGVIALDSTIEAGSDAGTLEGGTEYWMVRSLSYHLSDTVYFVRAKGTKNNLPKADTLDGEDSSDGSFNRLQKLPDYKGKVAIADDTKAVEGVAADNALAFEDFWTEEGGYSDEIADKLVVYDTQEEAMQAVVDDECQLGFCLWSTMKAGLYPDVEEAYDPPGGANLFYEGAACMGSENAGIVRDFYEFLASSFTG